MTKEKWIAYHDKKSPHDPYVFRENDYELFDENNGIMRFYFELETKTFILTEIIGNLKFWYPIALRLVKELGAKHMRGYSHITNIKALARLFKATSVQKIEQGGSFIYELSLEVKE